MTTAPTPTHRRTGRKRVQRSLALLGMLLVGAIVGMIVVDRLFFPQSSGTPVDEGSGVAATQTRTLPPFTGVDLAGHNNVIVQVGARQSVVVHGDSNLLAHVTTRVRSGALVIGNTADSFRPRTRMYVQVNVPFLDRVRLRGAGNISVAGINSRELTVALPGAGNLGVSGTTSKLVVGISGAGNAQLRELVARDASAVISGNGSLMLTATRRLDASVSGSGTIVYSGDPAHVTRTVTGAGTIIAR